MNTILDIGGKVKKLLPCSKMGKVTFYSKSSGSHKDTKYLPKPYMTTKVEV